MKKIPAIIVKCLGIILLAAVFALCIGGLSPIYDFEKGKPFNGEDIFNPYRNIDSSFCWKKANFHTHTRIKGLMNECPEWPDKVLERYSFLGYDIVYLTNHNQFTEGDSRPDSLRFNAYEHGYNLCQFHKLVFGSRKTNRVDNFLPLLASQCQWQFDILRSDADLIQFNHPARTRGMGKSKLEKLSGYDIFELNALYSETEHIWWDWALSAGHYSFALANDDLHDCNRTGKTGRRCNFLCCRTSGVENVQRCLHDGCFYCMTVPDFGNGDWEIKREHHLNLPKIKNIGLAADSTVFIVLDRPADRIVFTGQNGTKLLTVTKSDKAQYSMKKDDSYARITCHFSDGNVLYTNPFARYDKTNAATPYSESPHPLNIPLTVLWNLLMLLAASGAVISIRGIFRK